MDSPKDVQIVTGEDVFNVISRIFANPKKGIDCYFDAKNLPLMLKIVSANGQKINELRSSGAKFRCITEISRENLSLIKEAMKHFELYHTPCLLGSFLIVDDQEYVGYLTSENDAPRLLRIVNRSFLESQTFLVNDIFDRAIPAKLRILELGKGTGEEFMETIRDSFRVKTLISDLVRSAVYEIAILFSTKNSFLIAEREGILEEISQVSVSGIRVRILVMQDETVKEISDAKLKASHTDIQVNYLQQLLPTKITTLIIDQAKTLMIEVNDDTRETFEEAIGLSTYSNSESTVFSNVSMFESLWIQAELDKQSKARQAYFQLFKGFKLKDEIYGRRWSSKELAEKTKE